MPRSPLPLLFCLATTPAWAAAVPGAPTDSETIRFEAAPGVAVRYQARVGGQAVALTDTHIVWALGAERHRVSARLVDGRAEGWRAEEKLPGVRHYIRPEGSRTDVEGYARVVAEAVYPGIDVHYRSNDGALLSHTRRYGVDPQIRQDLAAADLEFRRQNDGRLLERLFNVNVYFRAYEEMELDQYAELERLRRAGIRTPAVPPEQTN